MSIPGAICIPLLNLELLSSPQIKQCTTSYYRGKGGWRALAFMNLCGCTACHTSAGSNFSSLAACVCVYNAFIFAHTILSVSDSDECVCAVFVQHTPTGSYLLSPLIDNAARSTINSDLFAYLSKRLLTNHGTWTATRLISTGK
jgi:hypothetical protein